MGEEGRDGGGTVPLMDQRAVWYHHVDGNSWKPFQSSSKTSFDVHCHRTPLTKHLTSALRPDLSGFYVPTGSLSHGFQIYSRVGYDRILFLVLQAGKGNLRESRHECVTQIVRHNN